MRAIPRIQAGLTTVFHWVDRRSGGGFSILRLALQRFSQLRGAESAASIAFFAIFSVFPLLLFLVSLLGFVLINVEAPSEVLGFIDQVAPFARQAVEENLLQILQQRRTGGLIGIIGLVWAASGVFTTLARSINRAWPGVKIRNILHGHLLGIAMLLILALGLFLLVTTGMVLNLLNVLDIPVRGRLFLIYDTLLWSLLGRLMPWLIAFIVLLSLYRWIPSTRVKWSEAFWGALAATAAWEVTTGLFSWYLNSGLAQYEILYGPLGASVALLSWIYIGSLITVFGAHLSAAVAITNRLRNHLIPPQD